MGQTDPRFVSKLVKDTYALVLAGGKGSRLRNLTDWRAKPAVPFGGKFRIIDFVLSNCVNSGVRRVGVATQYKAHSLIRHIQRGWSFLDGRFDEFVDVLPASQRLDLFLEPELLPLEFPESESVCAGPAHFVLNGLFEGLVTRSEFTNPGI